MPRAQRPAVAPARAAAEPYPRPPPSDPPASDPPGDGPATKAAAAPEPAPPAGPNADPLAFYDEIKLEGEDQKAVKVFDSCDEVRRKIRAFFQDPSGRYRVTQKRFLEKIGGVNSNSYNRFMKMKGEGSGAENGTFYGAYVFFEKLRIYEHKDKTKRRIDSENEFPEGRPLTDDSRRARAWVRQPRGARA